MSTINDEWIPIEESEKEDIKEKAENEHKQDESFCRKSPQLGL